MYRYTITIIATILVACGSSKTKYATEAQVRQYTGPYYVIFDFFPENSHSMSMGGIGNTFDVGLLRKDNLNIFIESFYNQLVYAPHILNLEYSYRKKLNCLGYDISWYRKYYIADITSDLIKEYKLKLEDENYINIRIYRILEDLDVKYVEDFKDCITSSSIELDINEINSINKVAILLDK